jgi:hypothetical protein
MTSSTRLRTSTVRAALVLGLMLAVATAAAPAASEPQVAAGNLGFQVKLRQSGPFTLPCSLMPPDATACIRFTGSGLVRGLGSVSVTYDWLLGVGPPACTAGFVKPLTTTGRLSVARLGTIVFTFAEGERCVPDAGAGALYEPQEFTITGGTGRFAAASGEGTRERRFVPAAPATETWTGTLEVQGLAFDVTAPELHAAGSKTVRAQKGAKSARVTFKVTATDGVDGAVPVSCQPRSGSRFEIGRTTVRCEATDSSGNAARAAFTVTVKRW